MQRVGIFNRALAGSLMALSLAACTAPAGDDDAVSEDALAAKAEPVCAAGAEHAASVEKGNGLDKSAGDSKFAAGIRVGGHLKGAVDVKEHTRVNSGSLNAAQQGSYRIEGEAAIWARLFGHQKDAARFLAYATPTRANASFSVLEKVLWEAVDEKKKLKEDKNWGKDLFEAKQTFTIWVIPVTVTVGARGEFGLPVDASAYVDATSVGASLTVTPTANVAAYASAGLGGTVNIAGIEIGLEGGVRCDLTIAGLGLPIAGSLDVGRTCMKWRLKGETKFQTLDGKISLYAKAPPVWGGDTLPIMEWKGSEKKYPMFDLKGDVVF